MNNKIKHLLRKNNQHPLNFIIQDFLSAPLFRKLQYAFERKY